MSTHAHRAGSSRRAGARRGPKRRAASAPAIEREGLYFRLAPRKTARGNRASRVDWDRFGRVALVIVLFVVVILYVNPVSSFLDAYKERKAEESRLAEVKAEHSALSKQTGAFEDPDAAELEAKKLGMVGAGERSYVIRGYRP